MAHHGRSAFTCPFFQGMARFQLPLSQMICRDALRWFPLLWIAGIMASVWIWL